MVRLLSAIQLMVAALVGPYKVSFERLPLLIDIKQLFVLFLISQLPFGPKDRLDNLESVYLTVGSPTLAAFSLALTILNRRWICRRFSKCTYPNARNAVNILIDLQQAPLRVASENNALASSEVGVPLAPSEGGALLASLVVLPQNDGWWKELVERLDSPHTWSVSAIASIAWVVTAFVFTMVDWFTNQFTAGPSAGQAVGALFLWLLPVVVGWLLLSPKCDEQRLEDAVDRTNQLTYVATDLGAAVPARQLPGSRRAITLDFDVDEDDPNAILRVDERNTATINNHARFLAWVQSVETVYAAFQAASIRYKQREFVNREEQWVDLQADEKADMQTRMGST